MTNQQHVLYRFYDATGALLYIGITSNPGNRFQQHAQEKPWWHEVRGITLELYPDRASVLQAETLAIHVEKPRFNKKRPSLPNGPSARPSPTSPDSLTWICDVCHLATPDGDGFVQLDAVDLQRARTEIVAWEAQERTTLYLDRGALADIPTPAKWQVHHSGCDPFPDTWCFYEVAALRTTKDLLRTTAHLCGKPWFPFTDWDDLIYRVTGANV